MTAVRQWVMAQTARRCALPNAGFPRRKAGRKRRSTSMTATAMWLGGVPVCLTWQVAAEHLHQRAAVLFAAVGEMHIDHGGVDVAVP